MGFKEFKIGVFGIILDENQKVLLCHRRDYDLWNLPGGGLEQGESPWDGVKREVKEETGLDVGVQRLAGVYYKPSQNEIVFSFVCVVAGGKIKTTDEANKIEYFEFKRIPKNIPPKQVERIKDAFKSVSKVMFRTQEGLPSIDLLKRGKLK